MDRTLVELLEKMKLDPFIVFAVVAAAFVIPLVLRGLFALGNTHHMRRKDSIEAWLKPDIEKHDLALELLVRNSYGVWLPAATIRRIRAMPFASQVFIGLVDIMQHMEPVEDGSRLRLKADVNTQRKRRLSALFYGAGYFISAMLFAFMLGIGNPSIEVIPLAMRIIFGAAFVFLAVFLLDCGKSVLKAGRFAARHPALFDSDQVEKKLADRKKK
jgi:hypothetical protein